MVLYVAPFWHIDFFDTLCYHYYRKNCKEYFVMSKSQISRDTVYADAGTAPARTSDRTPTDFEPHLDGY